MRVVGAAFFLVFVAAALAFPHGGRADRESPSLSPRAGAVQDLRVPATRFAVFDSAYLGQRGVNPKEEGMLAAIFAFGRALHVELFDVAPLMGKVLIADGRVDLSDAFIKALKSSSSGPTGLAVPAVNVPATTVAFVNTEAFGDARTGVTKLVKAFGTVEQEFKPRKEELEKLREEVAAAPADRRQKLEADIGKKQAAAQAALDKRLKALTGPVYEDIGRALVSFCKKHGITLIFDTSKMGKTDTLPPFGLPLPADAPDVTEAFVNAYNRGELKP